MFFYPKDTGSYYELKIILSTVGDASVLGICGHDYLQQSLPQVCGHFLLLHWTVSDININKENYRYSLIGYYIAVARLIRYEQKFP